MNIARGIARWTLAILISTFVSTWILVATVNATIANREVLKQWLASSGVYDHTLGNVLQVSASNQNTDLMDVISTTTLQQAFVKTFDASYLQQSTNTVIDASYSWLDGTAQKIDFTIPVQDKAAAFTANLAALIQPKLALLPSCTAKLGNIDTNHITCIPAGVNIADYANQLAQPSSENGFLNTPITAQSLAPNFPQLGWLPGAVQTMHLLLWALPVATVVCGALYVLASPEKLRGVSRFGRQLTLNAVIMLVSGLLLWYATTSVDLSATLQTGDAQQGAIISSIVNPLARHILPDVGKALSLYGGIVTALGTVLWLGAFLWLRKRRQEPLTSPVMPPTTNPPAEIPLPPPTRPKI